MNIDEQLVNFLEKAKASVNIVAKINLYLVYIVDYHGYLCEICGIFSSTQDSQKYIKENWKKVEYYAFTTAKFFEIKKLELELK